MYSVKFHPPTGWLKCADIYMNDAHGFSVDHHVETLYSFSWRRLGKKVDRWMKQHEHDIPIDWYTM